MKPNEMSKRGMAHLKELRYLILKDTVVPRRRGSTKAKAPADMDGHLATALFQGARQELRSHAQETPDESLTEGDQYSAEEAAEVTNRLRGLGYIE